MGFPSGEKFIVEQVDDKNWLTWAAIKYTGRAESFEVHEGSPTDFASVPKVFVWFLPRYGRYTRAAVLHDYLWRQRASTGAMKWHDADGVFRRAMRELGVPFLQRWIMWSAVRWASLKNGPAWRDRRLWGDLPLMLLFALVAAPVLLPPAAVILAAQAVWFVVEAVVWVPLKLVELAQRVLAAGSTPKAVNFPTPELRS